MLNATLYAVGWLIFLYGQMEGSLRSPSNGLAVDWASRKKWLFMQSDKLVKRAFFSAIFCPVIIKMVIQKIEGPLAAAGLEVAVWSASGLAGYCASGLVYQITGLFTPLRAEIPELAPTPELEGRRANGDAPPPDKKT